MGRLWRALDTLLHQLRIPHRWVCDRYDLALGVTRAELDRAPTVDVPNHYPIGWRCSHISMTAGGTATLMSVTASCGCAMRPVYQ